MSTPISPADHSAQRAAALQQRATTQLGREAKQAATGATGDSVTLSKTPDETAKAGAEVAVHTGMVKNDASGKSGDGTAASALGAAPTSTAATTTAATTADPATAAAGATAQAPEFAAGGPGATLPLGTEAHSAASSGATSGTPLDGGSTGSTPPASSARKDLATAQSQQQAEDDQVRAIFMQMWADRRKAQAEMWKMIQDTNNKIFEIIQGVAVNRAMSIKKGMDAWAQYILM